MDINNINLEEMNCWAVDDWAAFCVSLWSLQGQIKQDPAYISEAIDILTGIRKVLPQLSPDMRKYATDIADMVAGLCCDSIRGLADDCRWDARQAAQDASSQDDDDCGVELPREWFDGLDDD